MITKRFQGCITPSNTQSLIQKEVSVCLYQEATRDCDTRWRAMWPREHSKYQFSLHCAVMNSPGLGNWLVSSFYNWSTQTCLSATEHHEAYLVLLKLLKCRLSQITSVRLLSMAKAEGNFSSGRRWEMCRLHNQPPSVTVWCFYILTSLFPKRRSEAVL